jgi:hypothetical protein
LVVEDPAEVFLVRERPRLMGQKDPARIDKIDAGQPVFQGNFLGPDVLLDRHREVGPALDRGVVGDDQDFAAVDDPDAGHHARPGARRRRARRREQAESGTESRSKSFRGGRGQQLAARQVELAGLGRPALLDLAQAFLYSATTR